MMAAAPAPHRVEVPEPVEPITIQQHGLPAALEGKNVAGCSSNSDLPAMQDALLRGASEGCKKPLSQLRSAAAMDRLFVEAPGSTASSGSLSSTRSEQTHVGNWSPQDMAVNHETGMAEATKVPQWSLKVVAHGHEKLLVTSPVLDPTVLDSCTSLGGPFDHSPELASSPKASRAEQKISEGGTPERKRTLRQQKPPSGELPPSPFRRRRSRRAAEAMRAPISKYSTEDGKEEAASPEQQALGAAGIICNGNNEDSKHPKCEDGSSEEKNGSVQSSHIAPGSRESQTAPAAPAAASQVEERQGGIGSFVQP